MMKKQNYILLAGFMSFMIGNTVSAQSILNGSFENNSANFSSLTVPTEFGVFLSESELFLADPSAIGSNWLFGADAGIASGASAPDGAAVAWLNPNVAGTSAAYASQDVTFSVGSYNLNWNSFAGPVAFEVGHSYSVEVVELFSGSSVFSNTFSENNVDGVATFHSENFNITTAGNYRIRFEALPVTAPIFPGLGLGPVSAGDIFIDNVSIVPEPSTSLMSLLAIGFFITQRRR